MACTMYRMVEAPTNGTAGQIVDDFTLEALPAQFREMIEAARLAATACACTPARCTARPKRSREAAHRRACDTLARAGIQ